MKTLVQMFVAAMLITSLACGCGTPNKIAYKSVAAIVYAVDAAKNTYYDYRTIHGVTPATEAQFKVDYEKYQAAMKVVKEVQKTQVPSSDNVVTLGNELIGLIMSVTGNTKLKII